MSQFESPLRDGAVQLDLFASEKRERRPIVEEGVLVRRRTTSRSAAAIFSACEEKLVSHLRSTALWPEKERNRYWRIGDYSFYVISYDATPNHSLYAQFWSEAGDGGMILELSSGALQSSRNRIVKLDKQAILGERGFAIGGTARNYRKIVAVEGEKSLRPLAKEAIELLCSVLGFDGTQNLTYKLYLGTHLVVRHTIDAISPEDVLKLMKEWGIPGEFQRKNGTPLVIESRRAHEFFDVCFLDESKRHPGRFHALSLIALRKWKPDDKYVAANGMNARFPTIQFSVNPDGEFVLATRVDLHGDVTPQHLRWRFKSWRKRLGFIAGLI